MIQIHRIHKQIIMINIIYIMTHNKFIYMNIMHSNMFNVQILIINLK